MTSVFIVWLLKNIYNRSLELHEKQFIVPDAESMFIASKKSIMAEWLWQLHHRGIDYCHDL